MDRYACRLLLLHFLFGGLLLAGEPAALQIRVIQGKENTFGAGTEARNVLVVEVTDDAAKPVGGAAVSFLLPSAGPSGQFLNGLGSDIVFTGPDGQAVMPTVRWNQTSGAFDIRITAAKGKVRAGLLVPQSIGEPETTGQTAMVMVNPKAGGSGSGRKWLRRTLLVAGIAGATIAILAVTRKSSTSGNTTSSSPVTISPPTIVIGAPE